MNNNSFTLLLVLCVSTFAGTLQTCVVPAGNVDTLRACMESTVDVSISSGSYYISNPPPFLVQHSISIVGAAPNSVFIYCNRSDICVNITGNGAGNVIFRDVQFIQGYGPNIFQASVIFNSTVFNSTSPSSHGIVVQQSTVSFIGCTFTQNAGTNVINASANSTLYFTNSLFTLNSALTIVSLKSSTAVFEASNITGNHVTVNNAQCIAASDSQLQVFWSSISGNSFTGTGYPLRASNTYVTIQNSQISGNHFGDAGTAVSITGGTFSADHSDVSNNQNFCCGYSGIDITGATQVYMSWITATNNLVWFEEQDIDISSSTNVYIEYTTTLASGCNLPLKCFEANNSICNYPVFPCAMPGVICGPGYNCSNSTSGTVCIPNVVCTSQVCGGSDLCCPIGAICIGIARQEVCYNTTTHSCLANEYGTYMCAINNGVCGNAGCYDSAYKCCNGETLKPPSAIC